MEHPWLSRCPDRDLYLNRQILRRTGGNNAAELLIIDAEPYLKIVILGRVKVARLERVENVAVRKPACENGRCRARDSSSM